jgi:arabinofuranosyltransferase
VIGLRDNYAEPAVALAMNKQDRPEGEPSKDRLPWLGPLLLLVSIGLLAEAAYSWWPRTVDDAFITFRYAQNLVEGLGPVYNPGERVEGYSSPIWMLGSAAAIAAGADPVVTSKWAGLLAAGALSVAVYLALRAAGVRSWGAGLATCAVGGSFVLQLWSIAGMETAAYAALFFVGLAIISCVGGSVRGALWASVFLAAASLTRPEGMMFWVLGFGLYLIGLRTHPRRVLAYALPGLVIASHFAWRFAYYGFPFPNTYYAKTGGGVRMWRQGLDGFTNFLSEPAITILMSAALLGLAVGLARRESRRAAAIVGIATLVHLVWVVSVGDDGLSKYRFYVPVVGPIAFLLGLLFYDPGTVPLSRAERRRAKRDGLPATPQSAATPLDRLLGGLGVAAIITAVPLSVSHFHAHFLPNLAGAGAQYLEGNIKLGRHLAATRSPDTVIAVPSAGAIPFYSQLPTIDMYGLNDAHVARTPFPARAPGRMMKWDIPYVLSRNPDLIVFNRGYRRAGERHRLSMAPMDRDLVSHLRTDSRYAWTSIEFGDGSSFYVYERISNAVQ